ncbi:6-phosphogluconolactonase [Erysipelotrichaceae bacterium]|nr:6-phosphogluconolactonase [Erysipelotrichaceae bacterium]
MQIIIGTYTKFGGSTGIYTNKNSAQLADHVVGTIENPTFLCIPPKSLVLYSITTQTDGLGGIVSYTYDDGRWKYAEKKVYKNAGPCHLTIDQSEQYIVTSHYHAGKIEVYEIAGAKIRGRIQTISHMQYEENGQKSHVHQAVFSPNDREVIICDLGLDAIFVYPFNKKTGELEVEQVKVIKTAQGSGPRHLIFSKDGMKVYCLHELSGQITTYQYENGTLELLQELLPPRADLNAAAAIKRHPSLPIIYVSYRSKNIISSFHIQEDGLLQYSESIDCGGLVPRDLLISCQNGKLYSANQNSSDITIFSIGPNGELVLNEEKIVVPYPVCLIEV